MNQDAQSHGCDHRGFHVTIVALLALVTALTAGVVFLVLGAAPLGATTTAGGAFVGTCGLGLSIASYLRRS